MKYSIEQIEKAFFKALPFPAILYKLTEMMKEQKEPLYKLGQEIGKDAVLSAKILETANSPFYALKQRVSDLPHAVSLLGYKDVSMIVMRFVLKQTFSGVEKIKKSRLYPPKEIWVHSLKAAFISRAVARANNFPFPLDCYTAGLLHDIGKNATALCIERIDEIEILKAVNTGQSLAEAEKDVLGFDHAQISFQILKHMKISLEVSLAVRRHHENMATDYREMSFILALANVLAKFDQTAVKDSEELDKELGERFEMASRDIKGLDKIYDELNLELKNL